MGTYARTALSALLAATVFLAVGTKPVAAEVRSEESLQAALDEWASEIGAPGMTAQIVDLGGAVDEASIGVDGRGEPVDSSTPFVWGSVSKQFTAATVVGLERDGVIDRNTPVVEVVPGARQMLPDAAVTIDDLVHHTSGLPHDITITDDWTRRESATAAVASMSRLDGASARGTFRYSSVNYMLLQAVVEQSTGESFAQALRREVLEPADAEATITDPEEFTRLVPPGHVPFFGSSRAIDVGVDSAGLGYGYLAGSIEDLGRYASWRLASLQQGETLMPEASTGQGTDYGNGMFHEVIGGEDVWWHSGAVPGYYTYVALIPGQDKGVVLASDRYGEIEAERIAAVGRNLTTLAVDGSTTDLPASMAFTVLGVLLAVIAILIGLIGWVTSRLFSGAIKARSFAGAMVRIITTALLCALVVVGSIAAVPSIVGADLSALGLWAPDIALTFWILLAAVIAASVLVVTKEVVGYRRLGIPTGQ
nr:serine hydrolase domain-containing protein [Rhodococcus sp. (in: high G+C Gram-positive bacteria)]